MQELLAAVDRLPTEQREVLLLVAVEGMNYRDAAAILGIPEGTLTSRLGRAREALRRATADSSGTDGMIKEQGGDRARRHR
jgi:RNA polymerase sigma-70 factor, ECF subfamily